MKTGCLPALALVVAAPVKLLRTGVALIGLPCWLVRLIFSSLILLSSITSLGSMPITRTSRMRRG